MMEPEQGKKRGRPPGSGVYNKRDYYNNAYSRIRETKVIGEIDELIATLRRLRQDFDHNKLDRKVIYAMARLTSLLGNQKY